MASQPPQLKGAVVDEPGLHFTSCWFSRHGNYEALGSSGQVHRRCTAVWNSEGLSLHEVADSHAYTTLAEMKWDNVSSVWSSTSTNHGVGLVTDIAFETSGGSVDYLRCRVVLDGISGNFLHFLYEVKGCRFKEGCAPAWVMSSWAAPFYRRGFTSKRLRIGCGWIHTFLEVSFAVCVLAEFQSIFGGLLWDAGMALSSLGHTVAEGTGNIIPSPWCLLRRLVVFLLVIRCLHATIDEALSSVMTFRVAVGKANKSLHKKISRINSHLSTPNTSPTSAAVPAVAAIGREDRPEQQQKQHCHQTVEEGANSCTLFRSAASLLRHKTCHQVSCRHQ